MSKINRYIDSLLDLPLWLGFPIFVMSIIVPIVFTICVLLFAVLSVSPWFLLLPVVIWAACALNWTIKNKNK